MSARSDFLERLRHWDGCLQEELLFTKAPQDVEHNEKARLLRNGLAVAGFAILEDFAKTRVAEVLGAINGNAVRFDDLPNKLRRAALDGVLHAASSQLRLRTWTDAEKDEFVRETAGKLHSTSSNAFALSGLLFGGQRSNLGVEDLSQLLGVLGVDGGWTALNAFASRAGLGLPALEAVFRSAAATRHSAAHDASTDVGITQLESFRLEAMAIGLSFDALVSRSTRLLARGHAPTLAGGKVLEGRIGLRFLRPSANGWREIQEGKHRAVRVHPDLNAAVAGALTRAAPDYEVIVIEDAQGVPADWRCTDSL